LPATEQALDSETGLSELADAKTDLYIKWEQILMLGGPSTIAAARQWRNAAERQEWLVRNLPEEPSEWTRAEQLSVGARKGFYEAARAELGIVADEIPEDI
jgi:hypothetical protein